MTPLIAALSLSLFSAPAPTVNTTVAEFRELGIELYLDVAPERFQAHNAGDSTCVLFFADDELGLVATRVLGPGANLDLFVPEGVTASLQLEIAVRGEGNVTTTGALSMRELSARTGSSVFVQGSQGQLITWVDRGAGGPEAYSPIGHVDPAFDHVTTSPLHVPVIDPTEKPGDVPPPVEDKPLPPV